MQTETVLLKNGTRESAGLVLTIMSLLEELTETGFSGWLKVYDLVMICRDPNYKIDERTIQDLQERKLLQADGKPHDSTINIVLSAISGEGLNMVLNSPIVKVDKTQP